MIKWVKNNWTHPFWSSIFAGIILALFSGLISLMFSFFKQIPLAYLYDKVKTSYIQVSYLTMAIIIIVLFSSILSIILFSIIHFRLKRSKFPDKLKTKQFNLQIFLKGEWLLTYSHYSKREMNGQETVTFVNGNQYYIGNKWVFVLTDIAILKDIALNTDVKELKWTKTKRKTNQKHAREILNIIDENTIIGVDDLGCTIKYERRCD